MSSPDSVGSTGGDRPVGGDSAEPESRVGFESGKHMRGSLLMALGRGIGLGAGMLIQLIIVRMLTPEDFGDLAWGLAVTSIATAFVALGMDSMVSRFFTTYEEQRDDAHLLGVLVITTAVPIVLGAVVALLALFLNGLIWPGFAPSEQAAALLPLILLLAPLGAVDMILAELFASFGEAGTVFFRKYILDPALRLGAVALVFVLAGGVTQVAVALVAAATVGVLIYGQLTWRMLVKYEVFKGADHRVRIPLRPLAAAMPAAMTLAMVWAITNPLPTAVLGVSGDAVEVAYLRASLIIANLPITLRSAIAVMFLAGATRLWRRGRRTELAETYWTTGLWVGTITLPILVLLVGFPVQTATTLFGADYADAAPIMALTGAGLWLVAALGPSSNLLLVARSDRWTFLINLAMSAVTLVAILTIIPAYGAMGAAWVMVGSLLVTAAVRFLALRGLDVRVEHRSLFLRAYLAAAVAAGLAAGINALIDVGFVLALVISAVLCLAALLAILPSLDLHRTAPRVANLPILNRFVGSNPHGQD